MWGGGRLAAATHGRQELPSAVQHSLDDGLSPGRLLAPQHRVDHWAPEEAAAEGHEGPFRPRLVGLLPQGLQESLPHLGGVGNGAPSVGEARVEVWELDGASPFPPRGLNRIVRRNLLPPPSELPRDVVRVEPAPACRIFLSGAP